MPDIAGSLGEWSLLLRAIPAAIVFTILILVLSGPQLLADSMPENPLPDARTGFRRSDAFPIWPPAHFRYLAFLYSAHVLGMAVPRRRWLIRIVRLATIAQFASVFALAALWIAEDYRFDPGADILKSDMQRSSEDAERSAGPAA